MASAAALEALAINSAIRWRAAHFVDGCARMPTKPRPSQRSFATQFNQHKTANSTPAGTSCERRKFDVLDHAGKMQPSAKMIATAASLASTRALRSRPECTHAKYSSEASVNAT